MKRNTSALVWSFALALLATAPLSAIAAPRDGAPKGRAARMIEAVQNAADNANVKLDDEQKTKVHAIIEDAMAQAAAIQQERKAEKGADKDKGDREAMRTKVTELVQNTVTKVEGVLNDDQKTAFRAARKEERAKMREEAGQHGEKGDKPGDKPAK